MCPDAELLSAWVDGEVPSPWEERIASHLESCASCSDKVAGFRRLSMRLRSSGQLDESAVAARIAARLGIEAAAERVQNQKPSLPRSVPALSARRLALSLPVAAAAAVAILAVGMMSGRMLAGPVSVAERPTSSTGLAIPASAAPGQLSGSPTMDSLVRYLETQNAPVSITIQLPSNTAITGGGDPMIVKTPPSETVSLPPSSQGLGFVMTGEGK